MSWPYSEEAMSNTPITNRLRASHEDGYTLLELLVVLAILGFLVAIATPQVVKYLSSSKVQTAHTAVASISSALDLFRLDVGRYPSTDEGLNALINSPQGVDIWNGPYIKRMVETVDPWGNPYHYLQPGKHGEFDLFSYGPDESDESDPNKTPSITNW